jgi:hypothetical protein
MIQIPRTRLFMKPSEKVWLLREQVSSYWAAERAGRLAHITLVSLAGGDRDLQVRTSLTQAGYFQKKRVNWKNFHKSFLSNRSDPDPAKRWRSTVRFVLIMARALRLGSSFSAVYWY